MKDKERLPVRIPVLGIAEAAAVLQYERLIKRRTRHCANRFVHAAYQGNNLRPVYSSASASPNTPFASVRN